jgi:hypothetical protein
MSPLLREYGAVRTCLAREYLGFCLAGGAEIEDAAQVPTGTSHLYEHLLFRQNDVDGGPLSQIGAKWGLSTDSATTTGFISLSPNDYPTASQHLRQWIFEPRWPKCLIDQEKAIIEEEVVGSSRSMMVELRQMVLSQICPGLPFSRGIHGTALDRRIISVQDLARYHAHVIRRPICLFSLKFDAWPEAQVLSTSSSGTLRWQDLKPLDKVSCLPAALGDRAVYYGMRAFPGLQDDGGGVALAAYGALEYGALHPASRQLVENFHLRHLEISLTCFGSISLLTVKAASRIENKKLIHAAITDMLRDPAAGSTAERVRATLTHELCARADTPSDYVVDRARRHFFAAPEVDVAPSACILHERILPVRQISLCVSEEP